MQEYAFNKYRGLSKETKESMEKNDINLFQKKTSWNKKIMRKNIEKLSFNKTILKYKEFEFTKNKFQSFKHPTDRDKVVVNVKILCESTSFSNEKDYTHFIGYKTNNCIKLLCIILPHKNGCIKCFHVFNY